MLNNKGRSSKLRKSGYVTDDSSTHGVLHMALISLYYRGLSQQIFAIICQTERSLYLPKGYLFHARCCFLL